MPDAPDVHPSCSCNVRCVMNTQLLQPEMTKTLKCVRESTWRRMLRIPPRKSILFSHPFFFQSRPCANYYSVTADGVHVLSVLRYGSWVYNSALIIYPCIYYIGNIPDVHYRCCTRTYRYFPYFCSVSFCHCLMHA